MSTAALSVLGESVTSSLGAGPRGTGSLPSHAEWIEAAHPLPDAESVRAARRACELADRSKREGSLLLVLLSGGASSMLALPAEGISLEDKRRTIGVLLRSGAGIAELNCVRKHISGIKGGRLGVMAGRSLTLAISDVHVPPDDPATIGSGPTAGDSSTFGEALRIVDSISAQLPEPVVKYLRRGAAGEIEEPPRPGDPRLRDAAFTIIANRHTAMAGARKAADALGYSVEVIKDASQGDASLQGTAFAKRALERLPSSPSRACVIASGETTVTVRGTGRGGRNQEFAIGAALALASQNRACVVASIGTDGVDGPTDAAGGIVTNLTVAHARRGYVDLEAALLGNDAYSALDRLDGLIRWGATLTNVGDVHILLTMAK